MHNIGSASISQPAKQRALAGHWSGGIISRRFAKVSEERTVALLHRRMLLTTTVFASISLGAVAGQVALLAGQIQDNAAQAAEATQKEKLE